MGENVKSPWRTTAARPFKGAVHQSGHRNRLSFNPWGAFAQPPAIDMMSVNDETVAK